MRITKCVSTRSSAQCPSYLSRLPPTHWRIVSGVKSLVRHAVVNGITRKNPSVIAKVDNISCRAFGRAGLGDHDDASHGLEEELTMS